MDERDLLARMRQQVDRWEAAGDRRAIFLDCYSVMTRNVLAALDGDAFHDPAWVHRLLHRFAGYYFHALVRYEDGDPQPPTIWRQTFDAARDMRLQPIQHLILGVNAHINYDLVLTLVEILDDEWPAADSAARSLRYRDHRTINRIIAKSVDEVQDDILERYTPALRVADVALGRLDEWAIARLIAAWREGVWRRTMLWLAAPSAEDRVALHRKLERACSRTGFLVMQRWSALGGDPDDARRGGTPTSARGRR